MPVTPPPAPSWYWAYRPATGLGVSDYQQIIMNEAMRWMDPATQVATAQYLARSPTPGQPTAFSFATPYSGIPEVAPQADAEKYLGARRLREAAEYLTGTGLADWASQGKGYAGIMGALTGTGTGRMWLKD